MLFNDTDVRAFRPQRSEQTALQILGEVVRMNHALSLETHPEQDHNVFNKALQRAKQIAKHDVLVVIISDMSSADAQSEQLITQIAEHNDVLALLTHDASRLDGFPDALSISDGKQQREIQFNNQGIREQLTKDYLAEQLRLEQHLRRLAAPMLMISNGESTVTQLRRLFGVPAPETQQ